MSKIADKRIYSKQWTNCHLKQKARISVILMYLFETTVLIKNSFARNDTEDSQRKMSGS